MLWKSSLTKELPYQAHWLERFLLTTSKTKLILACFVATFIPTCVAENYYGMQAGIEEARESSRLQTVRSINLLLYSYAQEHKGIYPQGKSSTEIFQKLLDEKYASDPSIFYFPMDGKTKPTESKLKPENVCWDVTANIQSDDPDQLPTVFMTGYKIDYAPGGKGQPLGKKQPGLAIAYMSNSAVFIRALMPSGVILNTISEVFDPKGRIYHQLTPEGPLPSTAVESE